MPVEPGARDPDLARAFKAITPATRPAVHLVEQAQGHASKHDPRARSPVCDQPVKDELDGFSSKKVFDTVRKTYVPAFANIQSGSCLRGIRNPGSKERVYNARFVVQGHRDRENRSFVHDTATLQHHSLSIMLSIAGTYALHVCRRDVTQAYVQGIAISRGGSLRPGPSLELLKGHILRIIRPMYVLGDAGDVCWSSIRDFITSSL